jgi:hypothetical protein
MSVEQTQRCPKHGVFKGTGACPWCEESENRISDPQHPSGTKIVGGAPHVGVRRLSKERKPNG